MQGIHTAFLLQNAASSKFMEALQILELIGPETMRETPPEKPYPSNQVTPG